MNQRSQIIKRNYAGLHFVATFIFQFSPEMENSPETKGILVNPARGFVLFQSKFIQGRHRQRDVARVHPAKAKRGLIGETLGISRVS